LDIFETAVHFILDVERPAIIAEMIARRSVAYALSPLVGRDGLGWFRRLAKVHQFALRV
jgi:hypothetical protein